MRKSVSIALALAFALSVPVMAMAAANTSTHETQDSKTKKVTVVKIEKTKKGIFLTVKDKGGNKTYKITKKDWEDLKKGSIKAGDEIELGVKSGYANTVKFFKRVF